MFSWKKSFISIQCDAADKICQDAQEQVAHPCIWKLLALKQLVALKQMKSGGCMLW